MLAQSMRPKYTGDTYSIPMSDGVYIRGNNRRLLLKGKSLYPLLEHLVPHLNGNITLEELTTGLDADRKRMVTNLIEKLFTQHFLTDVSQDQHHTLSPLEQETYATNIAFIESFQTSASYRFEAFRNKHILLLGSGHSLTSLIQASLQGGVKQITVIPTLEDEPGFHLSPETFVTYDDRQTVRCMDAPSWENEVEVRQAIQGYDAVLHIATRSMLPRARLINRLCLDEQKMLIQAITGADHAWIGPLVAPGTTGCWECAWRRLQANQAGLADDCSRDEWHISPLVAHDRSLTVTEASLIAQQLIFALFQSFTQIDTTERAGKVSIIDFETLQSENHMFLPHPHCLACQHPVVPTASQFLERVQQLQQQTTFSAEDFLETLVKCVDDQCGLFTTFTTTPFVQMPLAVYKVHLANPLPGKNQPASFDILAASLDTKEARMRTLFKACECYTIHAMDRRRLLSSEHVRQLSSPVVLTRQLIGATPDSEEEMWTWALDLQTQQVALVPAFPRLPEQGIGSGESWEEAVCQALLSWCNYLTIGQLKDTQQPYLQVDLENIAFTPEGEHLYRLLKTTGKQLAVYDVTGSLHVPTFAVCLDERVVTYSTHCNPEQALRMGLEQALQHYQSDHFHQAEYALNPVPDCPAHLRSEQVCLPQALSLETWTVRKEWLLQQLQASGLHSFAIPLEGDPALTRAFPFLVRVLLSQDESEKGA